MSEKDSWKRPAPEPEQDDTPEPFLRRWARLKADPAAREAEPTTEAPAAPPAEHAPTAVEADTAEGADEQLPPADEDLPPLEALDEHSDYSGFMSPRVSQALRKQALRKLFRSQKFNYICELDDYIDDYTSFPPLGDMITADMKHAAERLLKKQLEAEEAEAEAAAAAATGADGEDTGDTTDVPGDETVAAAAPEQNEQTDDAAGDAPEAAPDASEDKQRDA
jgi:hypothetical protein